MAASKCIIGWFSDSWRGKMKCRETQIFCSTYIMIVYLYYVWDHVLLYAWYLDIKDVARYCSETSVK